MRIISLVLLAGLLLFSCSKQDDKAETGKSREELQAIAESGLDYKQPKIKKTDRNLRQPRIEALFTINPDALNLQDLNKVTNVFDEITEITFKMIDASTMKQRNLEKQANQIVQRYGYKDLRDFGDHLEVYTWAAGTYLKLQSVDEAMASDPQSRISKALEESLKGRLKKQKISNRDLDLIRANWYKIDKVLQTMEEMTMAADKKEMESRQNSS